MGIGGAIASVAGSVIASKAQSKAAGSAADAQEASGREAIAATERASEKGLGFLEPFGGVAQPAVDQASFLLDPQERFDFLQSNPLFQLALDNANRETKQFAASRNRLSAGDTLQQLSNNVLLSAQPLISEQSRNISGLLDFGRGVATAQANTAIGQGSNVANLLTDIGSAKSAGIVGVGNAQAEGVSNLVASLPGLFNQLQGLSRG